MFQLLSSVDGLGKISLLPIMFTTRMKMSFCTENKFWVAEHGKNQRRPRVCMETGETSSSPWVAKTKEKVI